MKLATASVPVEVSGGGSTSSFSIAMNAKAFRVLSDTLYQNKIGSIVREVSCNALDAHIMGGKPDLPFVIHLPDSFEPWFSVQDFGVGLSPEDITSVFTVYFQSTKDDANDAVGAFGLGAKTPFSYTDQFTVTSVRDGMRRIYSAYIQDGMPTIVEMAASATTDANGVEIKMSVKREDYNKFADEVATQLRFFKVKPTIVNRAGFQFKSVSSNLVIDSKNVAISNDSAGYGQSWAHVIQGNVGYPLDVNQINEKISADSRRMLDALRGFQTRFYFDIGEIGVTASREGVEYNAHTIANIEKKLATVAKELTAYIEGKLKQFKTDWDKALFINSSPAIRQLASASNIKIPNVKAGYNGMYSFDFSDMLFDPNEKDAFGHAKRIGTTKAWKQGKAARETCDATITPNNNSKVYIVLRDTANKPNIRAKHFLSSLSGNYHLIEVEMMVEEDFGPKFIKRLSGMLGGFADIKKLSEIEPPARETVDKDGKRVRASYTRPTHYAYTKNANGNIRDWNREFDALDENEDDTVFVVIKDMAPMGGDAAYQNIAKYNNLLDILNAPVPLVGIRENDVKKIDGMKNYIPLEKYVSDATKKLKNDRKLYIKWRHGIIGSSLIAMFNHHIISSEVIDSLNKLAPDKKPTRIISFVKSLPTVNYGDKLQKIGMFMGWDSSKVMTASMQKKATKFYEGMLSEYPLLRIYSDWQVRSAISAEHLAKYVAAM